MRLYPQHACIFCGELLYSGADSQSVHEHYRIHQDKSHVWKDPKCPFMRAFSIDQYRCVGDLNREQADKGWRKFGKLSDTKRKKKAK